MTIYYFEIGFHKSIVLEDGIAYDPNNGEELFNIIYDTHIQVLEFLSFASKRI